MPIRKHPRQKQTEFKVYCNKRRLNFQTALSLSKKGRFERPFLV